MPQARTRDGATLDYREFNFTPPWTEPRTIIMAHGLRSSQDTWNEWIPTLARHYRVITFDARGRGESPPPPPGFHFSMEHFASDAAAVLDAAGVAKAHYIGTSFGGVTGEQFAVQYPERLYSLVLVTAPYRFTQLDDVVTGWIKSVREDGLETFTRRDVVKLFSDKADPRALDWQTRQMMRLGPELTVELFTYMKTVNMDEVLPRIATPTLVMAATASDRAPTADLEHLASRIPNARLEKFEGYHHNIAMLVPNRCAELALGFIQEVDARG